MGKQYSQKELIMIAKAKGWDIDETRGTSIPHPPEYQTGLACFTEKKTSDR
ncbi:MAG: hypothetical protein STSR0007_07620 [Thermovirga sp.]